LYIALSTNIKHLNVQIITWLVLNNASLLVRYLNKSVKCQLLSNTPWMLSFSFSNTTHQRTAAHGVQHSSVAAVQNFISLTAMALAAQKNKLN